MSARILTFSWEGRPRSPATVDVVSTSINLVITTSRLSGSTQLVVFFQTNHGEMCLKMRLLDVMSREMRLNTNRFNFQTCQMRLATNRFCSQTCRGRWCVPPPGSSLCAPVSPGRFKWRQCHHLRPRITPKSPLWRPTKPESSPWRSQSCARVITLRPVIALPSPRMTPSALG